MKIMEMTELTQWLDRNPGWSYETDEKGILIKNEDFGTATHCTFEAVGKNSRELILKCCFQGKNVDHITRVTGYFSRTSQWNAGKRAELRDRKRYALSGN